MDRFEIERISAAAEKLTPLCGLQPDNLSTQVQAINQGIASMLEEALPHLNQQPDHYPPNLVANLSTQVAQLLEAVKGIWGTDIEYPDVEAPLASPPPGH